MRRNDLKNKISSKKAVPRVKSIQVFDEKSNAYFNFINSLNCESTMKSYEFCREILEPLQNRFRVFAETTVARYIKSLSRYLVRKKISKSYKNQILSALKHVCEMNDVILNWKKLKKLI